MRRISLLLLLVSCHHSQEVIQLPASREPVAVQPRAEPEMPPSVDWEGYDLETRQEDLDKDGLPETIEQGRSVGSGFRHYRYCVRRGSDGQQACGEELITVYSRFSGFGSYPVGDPPGVDALALLPESTCAQADRQSPAQASMWLLEHPEGIASNPQWFPGRPVEQHGVCVDGETARRMIGGLIWAGGLESVGSWTVAWWPARVDFMAPFEIGQRDRPWLKRVVETDAWEAWFQGHAVAVYDRARDRHAWVANLEGHGVEGINKVDRWPVIATIRIDGDTLVIELVGEELEHEAADTGAMESKPRRRLELLLPATAPPP